MEEENFSPQESLQLIQSMIAKTRKNMGDKSSYFLLWGWLTFIGFIGQFVLKNLIQFEMHYLVWLLAIPGAVISIYWNNTEKKVKRASTYVGESMKYLWTGMGICYFVLCMILSRMGWGTSIYPFFILMYGLGTFLSGKFLQFKPMVLGGLAAWVLAIAAAFVGYDYQMLFGAGAILISYIVPAYLLRQKNQSSIQ